MRLLEKIVIIEIKDWLFDVLNELDDGILADIDTNEKKNVFYLKMIDGSEFEIKCQKR